MTPLNAQGLRTAARKAREAAQTTAAGLHTGTGSGRVTLDDGRTYDAAIVISGLGPVAMADGGTIIAQTLVATISKSDCRTEPAQTGTLLHTGKAWNVQRVAGQNALDAAWVLTCTRQPGSDV